MKIRPKLNILPEQYKDKKKTIILWALIGLFTRLVFMPITFHPDLLEAYWLAHKIVDLHAFNLGKYIQETFNVSGGGYISVMGYIHAVFLLILKPFLPAGEAVWIQDHQLVGLFCDSLASHYNSVATFASRPHIHRILFLYKLPYLILDYICAVFLFRILDKKEEGLFAFKLWMINFASIFVVYIWGKYELIPIFFILLSIYYARKSKNVLSVLTLGVSIICKFYTLLLLLLFSFVLGKTLKKRIVYFLLGLVPFILMFLLIELANPTLMGGHLAKFSQVGLEGQFSFLLNAVHIRSGVKDITIYVFPFFYTIILWFIFSTNKHSVYSLERYSLFILLFFYATCYFNWQYFIWMLPFLVIVTSRNKQLLLPHIIQTMLFIIFALDFGMHIVKLFFPLNPGLAHQTVKAPEVVRSILHPFRDIILHFARTMFSATCFWMMYVVFKERECNELKHSNIK